MMERLLDYFVPERYDLEIEVNKGKKQLRGVVKIKGEAKRETVKFHAVGLSVDTMLVNGKNVVFKVEDGLLTLFKVPISVLDIEVGYHGSLNENMQGAYLSTYEYEGKTETIVATQFESHYAREAFPCIDEPAAKAVFALTLTADAEDTILANMPKIEGSNGVDGQQTVKFAQTPRMSTYLLAWVIGKFHGKTVKNRHGVEITTYVALNQDIATVDFANEIAARALEFYDDNFGVKYPLMKLDQVALPDFEAGAMENWGLVTYRESMLLAAEGAALGTKKSVALTVAHELSHQWFGDLTTMAWWDDLWLNESFASVMEYYAVDYIHPEYRIFEEFFTGDALAALKRDCLSGVQAVHQEVENPEEIATLFDPAIVYAKGARLMLMVIRLMGWENFTAGIREYFAEHQYGNTVGDDLWAALGRHAEFDVGALMHAYIDEPGYPVITGVGEDFRKFTQKRFLLDGKMRESAWVLPEITEDMSGHYVLNLSEVEFAERLKDFDELGLEEKLRLLIDRDLTSRTELAAPATVVELLRKFQGEESAAVWSVIATMVGGLKVFFDPGTEAERKFKDFVKELVRPKLTEVGLETRAGDDENTLRLRALLTGMDMYGSVYADDAAERLENMRRLAVMYREDLVEIDAEVRGDVLAAVMYLEPERLEEFIVAYSQAADPEVKYDLLFAMTMVDSEAAGERMLKLLEEPEIVKPQDQFHLFIYLYRNPRLKAKVFQWLTEHWEYVKGLAGDKSLDNYPRYVANSVRTEGEAQAYAEFFGPMKAEPALARATTVGENEIRARLKLIREDAEGVQRAVE